MSVELSPSAQLGFHRPLTQLVKRTLTVANHNHQPVAFKVKTTAPKNFCVRPNSGRIEPGERVEVQVLLQPMKEEPAPDAKCRDKFLIQSAIITPDIETRSLQDLWALVEADAKAGKEGAIHEQKIRCAYLAPVEETGLEGSNGAAASAVSMSSPDASANNSVFIDGTPAKYETVRGAPSNLDTSTDFNTNGRGESPIPQTAPESKQDRGVAASIPTTTDEVKAVASNAATGISNAATNAAASLGLTGASTTGASTSSAGSASDSKLQQEIQSLKSEVQRLKDVIAQKEREASAGLRQRNVPSASTSSSVAGSQTAVMTQEGVPLPMVGAIAFGVFFFTWLLF